MTDTVQLDEIRLLEERLHRPEVRRSRAAVEELLADGFVEFGASGTVYDRAEIIDLLVEQDDAAEPDDLRAANYALRSLAADVVLLTYKTRRMGADGSERQVLRSSIWKHTGARWQLLFHQGTLAKSATQHRR